jgi:two-component system response regulator AtoC
MHIDSLRAKIQQRHRITGAAVGSGLTAKAAQKGGADLLMVLTAGYFRMQGISSMAAMLPYTNANEMGWQIAIEQVMPRAGELPVVLGVCGQDEEIDWPGFLSRAKSRGISGVTNFPTVAFIDGKFRAYLEDNGYGFKRETEVLRIARDLGLFTIGFCLSTEEAIEMAGVSVDVICLNLGFAYMPSRDPSEHQSKLDEAILFINETIRALKKVRRQPYVVVFGGPVILPRDVALVYERTEALGYIGGSTVESFPTEPIIAQTVGEFKQMARMQKSTSHRLGAMLGCSSAMQEVFEMIRQVADSHASVLIVAESGAGKELAAREIHRLSNRFVKPMVCWNCSAISETLAMSELFGHEKGSFTGAAKRHVGKFEAAHGGTLFMDEVADLPLPVQASVLRAIQEREILRVGGEQPFKVDVRLIAATNKDFREIVPAKLFRLDLYYRLSTVTIRIPPLRERPEDIPLLIKELLQEFSHLYNCESPRIPDSVMQAFMSHAWPGNIRELRNVLERGFILGRGRMGRPAWHTEFFNLGNETLAPDVNLDSASIRRKNLSLAMAKHNGNKLAAARELGISRRTIYNWLSSTPG